MERADRAPNHPALEDIARATCERLWDALLPPLSSAAALVGGVSACCGRMSPQKKSLAEIHLRRLLHACENNAQSFTSPDKARLLKYVEAMQGNLAELKMLLTEEEAPDAAVLPSERDIEFYEQRIAALVSDGVPSAVTEAQSSPPELTTTTADPATVTATAATISSSDSLSSPIPPPTHSSSADPLLLPIPEPLIRKRRSRAVTRDESSSRMMHTDAVLADEREQQDEIATDMVDLAGALKDNAKRQASLLQDDARRLGDLELATESNIAAIRKVNTSAFAQLRSSWSFTCCVWILLVVVLLLVFWTFFFMKAFPRRSRLFGP